MPQQGLNVTSHISSNNTVSTKKTILSLILRKLPTRIELKVLLRDSLKQICLESNATEHIDESQSDLDEAFSIGTTQNLAENVDGSVDASKGLKLFEGTEEKTVEISQLLQSLLSIKPVSTDCERAFSIAGNFKTKMRNTFTQN